MAEEIKGLDAFFSGQGSAPDLRVDQPNEGVAGVEQFLTGPASDAAITNLQTSRDVNPDAEAEKQRRAKQFGVEPDALEYVEDDLKTEEIYGLDKFLKADPATANFLADPNNAKVAHDSVKNLSFIERLIRGYERGETMSELGYAGLDLRSAPQSENAQTRVKVLQERLRSLGNDTEGFVSGLAGVMEFFGQRVASVDRPEAAARISAGAAAGSLTGLAGGIFAPLTVTAGAIGGGVSGFVGHQIMDVGEVEAGLSYVEQLEAGVNPDVAYWTSLGVGIINAGLETLGGASFLKPLSDTGKRAFREGLKGIYKNPKFTQAISDFVLNYSMNVGVETGTEVAQEVVNIAAEELGKQMTDGSAEWTPDEWSERLSDIAIKTLKTTAILAAPGSGYRLVSDIRQERQAEQVVQEVDSLMQELDKSPLTKRDPEKAAKHVAMSYAERGVRDVYVPVEELDRIIAEDPTAEGLYEQLGVQDQLDEARELGGDVRINMEDFALNVIQAERGDQFKEHTKFRADGLTKAQAEEQADSRELDQAERDVLNAYGEEDVTSRDVTSETDTSALTEQETQALDLAEHELGMQALFTTAKDAGMTEPTYASYLESIKRVRERAKNAVEKRRLKREAKRVDKEYQNLREDVTQQVRDELSTRPIYEAFLGIGKDRLDYQSVLEVLGDEEAMKALPKYEGQRIFAPKNHKGQHIKAYAELYGMSPDIFLYQLLDNPSFDEAVATQVQQRMEQEFPTILSEREEIDQAIRALSIDKYADMMAFELARIRQQRGLGRLKLSVIRNRARTLMEDQIVRHINAKKFEAIQKRESMKARKAVRSGDWEAAAKHKTNQILAFEMARESYKYKDRIAKGNKFLSKFLSKRKVPKTLPLEYLDVIREKLADYQLGPRLSEKKRTQLVEFAQRKALESGTYIPEIPQRVLDADGKTHVNDLALREWNELYQTIKTLDKMGRDENKFRNAAREASVDETVDQIVELMEANLKPRQKVLEAREVAKETVVSRWETMKRNWREGKDKFGVELAPYILNIDTVLREIDGFNDLGLAYDSVKRGIDRATTEGYLEGHIGLVRRTAQVSKDLVQMFDMFSKSERSKMGEEVYVPNVRRRLKRREKIAVLLNLGNEGNRQALLDSEQFTEQELDAVLENASDRDLAFAQNVWDYLDSFYDEIKEAHRRRFNKDVEKVPAREFEVRGKTYRGGYYPLQYDTEKSAFDSTESVQEAKQAILTGGFTRSHTKDYHTEAREGTNADVKLDPFVLNDHINMVLYDLEMGDAIIDAYKVVHNKKLKQAFVDSGHKEIWEMIDVWLGDVTTGELHRHHLAERGFRALRAGTTISAMGINMSVAALQPLGLIQSSVQIGHRYVANALFDVITSPMKTGNLLAPYGMLQWVTEQSGFMMERENAFNKDITEARRSLNSTFFNKVLPGRVGEHMGDATFLFIRKAQRMVDFVTWIAAYKKGLKEFNGDTKKAAELGDRMVARSQGSGNFQERTAFERGTLHRNVRQSELVRSFSLFLNYFAAKANVAYERSAKFGKAVDIKHPFKTGFEAASYASDMALLFVVEGLLASVIREGWPDEEQDDPWEQRAAWEGIKGATGGIPIVREIPAFFEGFEGGGAWGSLLGRLNRVKDQALQGEVDDSLLKSINAVLGIAFKYPSGQINKTGSAIYEDMLYEDIEWYEYMTGPRYEGP